MSSRPLVASLFLPLSLLAAQSEPASPPADSVGVTASFSWGDVDGDGRLELAAVTELGELRVLAPTTSGQFEDATERLGLGGIGAIGLAIWSDYDSDGRIDLFLGALEGRSMLFHNEGETFVDMSMGSGLRCEGHLRAAEWLDFDEDGRPDLFAVTTEGTRIFRGLEGGFFEEAPLPFNPGIRPGFPMAMPPVGEGELGGSRPPESDGAATRPAPRAPRATATVAGTNSIGSRLLIVPPAMSTGCALSISDQASPGVCLNASTTPALGKLYPLSSNLFVAVGGNVGIGTTSPSAKLDVAGTARVTDTLTLAPSGDVALNVSTGSIYKGGSLFLHAKGSFNTGLGVEALRFNTTGANNTANGFYALRSNTTGSNNTANGRNALLYNTTGTRNTASGVDALRSNTTGINNTASGFYALRSNTTGSANTANGRSALLYNTTGNGNTASGVEALRSNTTGGDNTASGFYALSSNTTGRNNMANGSGALQGNTTGSYNTASGGDALRSNTVGLGNAACGFGALQGNTSGSYNTACGAGAILANTVGSRNVGIGYRSLISNTSGSNNTALGFNALLANTTGFANIAIGQYAGWMLTGGRYNIDIGNPGVAGESYTIRVGRSADQNRAFIAGVRGITTGLANAIPVLIDSDGQLGTVSSSRRFKEDIRDMGDATRRLLELRPVLFRYKQAQTLPNGQEVPPEYGLIAEEVAEIMPDLVVYDEDGKPFTVKYHMLSSMLLNELELLAGRFEMLRQDHETTREQLATMRQELEQLRSMEARLGVLEGVAGAH